MSLDETCPGTRFTRENWERVAIWGRRRDGPACLHTVCLGACTEFDSRCPRGIPAPPSQSWVCALLGRPRSRGTTTVGFSARARTRRDTRRDNTRAAALQANEALSRRYRPRNRCLRGVVRIALCAKLYITINSRSCVFTYK